jgi:tetratricopeptide (TPR) repeat protein
MGDNSGSLAAAQEAFLAAEGAADDALAARAAAASAFELAAWLGKSREGERWLAIATKIAGRAGHDDSLEATLLHNQIIVTAMLGHPERTLEAHDREIAAMGRLYGERSPLLASATLNKGVSLTMLNQYETAIATLHRAVDLFESVGGLANPQLDLYYDNLGTALMADRQLDEARTAFQHVLSVEGDRAPGRPTMVAFFVLATIEVQSGHPLEALEYLRKGMETGEAMGEAAARYMPVLHQLRGEAHLRMGDAAGAASECRRAVSMMEAQGLLDASAPYPPDALRCLGESELALGHVGAAIKHLERSVSFERRFDPTELAAARFALARALAAGGRDPARAVALAQDARAAYAARARFETEVALIDAWLSGR